MGTIFSEFQPLEKVIVGSTYSPESYDGLPDEETRGALQTIAHETNEDCEKLSQVFSSFGAQVYRPTLSIPLFREQDGELKKSKISNGIWETTFPNSPLWPRDLSFVLGSKIASVYSRNHGRWLEGQAFHGIFTQLFKEGYDWISMPPPLLDENAPDYAHYENREFLFHAACLLKCGRDIFHTPSGSMISGGKGTELGLSWIKRQFPEFRFHSFERPGHIDGKFALLRPGLLLSWVKKEHLPLPLQNWEIVYLESKAPLPEEFLKLRGKRFYKNFVLKWLNEWVGNVDETYFDVNVVSLDEKTVILNSSNLHLIRTLEAKGMQCIPFDFKHRHFWDGGLHCMTLDLQRKGPMEDYFND